MSWEREIRDAQAGIREGYRSARAVLVKQGGLTGPAHNPTRSAGAQYTCYYGDRGAEDITENGYTVTLRRFVISSEGMTVAPEATDTMIVDGGTVSIVSVEAFQPGGEVIYWKVRARGE